MKNSKNFLHPSINPSSKSSSNTYFVPGTTAGPEDTKVKRSCPCPMVCLGLWDPKSLNGSKSPNDSLKDNVWRVKDLQRDDGKAMEKTQEFSFSGYFPFPSKPSAVLSWSNCPLDPFPTHRLSMGMRFLLLPRGMFLNPFRRHFFPQE